MTLERDEQRSTARMRDGVLDTHQQIREMTRRLEEAANLVELLAGLQAFRALLVPHFADEEGPDGFFDLVRTATSRHLVDVRQLEREHADLLRDIAALVDRAVACLAGPVAEILKQGGELARRVRDHEARESALLVDALYVDVGGE